MATEAASIFISVDTDADKAKNSFKGVTKEFGAIKKSGSSMTGSLIKANVAIAGAKAAFNILKNTVKGSIDAFNEQARVEKQLETVLKSTGNAAGLTAKEIKGFASELQGITTFGDEATIASSNLLLTFKEVGGDTFKRAQRAILDVSTAMGQDLKSSTVQVGKALNDPIKGLTALSRTGITFTESQKEVIKTLQESGDIAGAQAIILEELESQFKGSAEAAANTFGGALKQLKNEQGDVLEKVGAFASLLGKDIVQNSTEATASLNKFLSSEKTINFMADAIARVTGFFAAMKTVVQPLIDTVFKELASIIDTVKGEFEDVTSEANILEPVLQGIAIAGSLIGLSFKVVSQVIKNVITNIGNQIKVLKNVGATIKTFFDLIRGKATFEDLKNNAADVGDSIKEFGRDYVGGFKDIITTGTDGIKQLFNDGLGASSDALEQYKEVAENTKQTVKDGLLGTAEEIVVGTGAIVDKQKEILDQNSKNLKNATKEDEKTFKDHFANVVGIANQAVTFLSAIGDIRSNLIEDGKKESREAIIFDRALAIAQVQIQAAAGIVRAFGEMPYFAAIPAAIGIGATSTAQTIAIATAPIPSAQMGGDFTVPVGGANDSALLRVNSGEQVSVTPARDSDNNSFTNGNQTYILRIGNDDYNASVEKSLNSGNVFIQRSGVIDSRAVV